MKSFWKRFRKYIITLGVVALLGFFLWPKPVKTEYVTEKVEKSDVEQIVSVTGTVESENRIELHFQKPGKIEQLNVRVGDQIKAGTLLATLDTRALEIQVQQAKAGVDLAKANLNLKLAGPSQEQKAVAQKDVDSAQVAYQAAQSNLSSVQLSAAENEKKARLAVANGEVAVANAETVYKNALASSTTTTETSANALADAYTNAKTAVNLAVISMRNTFPLADSILGIDQPSVNDAFEAYLGALNSQSKIDAQNDYPVAKTAFKKAEQEFTSIGSSWQPEQIDALLPKVQEALQLTKEMTQDTYVMLINSIAASNFPQTTIDGYKTSISTQETALTNDLKSLQAFTQAITNAKLGISSTQNSTSTSVDNAQAALNTAKNNLAVTKSSLDQAIVENHKMITAAEADVNLKKAAVARANVSYDLTVASPRNVDLAALRAQISQVEAAYQLALQNLKDGQIIAPLAGVATEVNGEVGENISGNEIIVTMISPQLNITANVSETDITKVKVGDPVTMTLDAFPPDVIFQGKVSSIDPAETVAQGVIYYRIKTIFEIDNPGIKSGMTANLDILAQKKENVLSVSPQAVQYRDNQAWVKVLRLAQPEEIKVSLGLQGNDKIEVLSGLAEGEDVVLYEKTGG